MASLYRITQEHLELIAKLQDNDGELTPELEQALNINTENLAEKLASCGYAVKKMEDEASLIDAEIKRLQELKAKATKARDYLKQAIDDAMRNAGLMELKHNFISLSYRKSTAVEVYDLDAVPEQYLRRKETVAADLPAIRNAIKAGELVDGVEYVERQNLQIK